jgi:hypothetical protein
MDQERTFLHDISSPLTSIQLNVESAISVLEEGTPESMLECLNILRPCLEQANRAADMIRARRNELTKVEKK